MRRYVSLAALLVSFLLFGTTRAYAPLTQRTYVAGRFALELDGKSMGYAKSIAGGSVSADVVEEPESPEYFVKKHLEDPPFYKDISIECGLDLAPEFYQWVRDSMELKTNLRKSGAILAIDSQGNIRRRVDFSNAQITEVTFPALDASNKNPGTLKVQITPSSTFLSFPTGKYQSQVSKGSKSWSLSNFNVAIKGLDTSRVTSVGELVVKIPFMASPNEVCISCPPITVPMINFPQLQIVGPEAFAATWMSWHEDFVLNGKHSDADEKSGTLDYLDPKQASLLTLNFTGLGIYAVENEPASAADAVARVRASMYVEKMTLTKTP